MVDPNNPKTTRVSQDEVIQGQGYGTLGGGDTEMKKTQEEIQKGMLNQTIKAGTYPAFEGEDGNLVDGDLKIVGFNDDGSYKVVDSNGKMHDIPWVDKSYE